MTDADSQKIQEQESSTQRVRAYRQRNPDKVSDWNRDYYERNKDRIKRRQTLERDTEN